MPTFSKTDDQIKAVKLLSSDASHSLLYGGSRSGKTVIYLRSLILRALKAPSRHLIVRYAFNHVKQSIWHDSFPKVMDISFPGLPVKDNRSDWFKEFPNGSQIWFGGLDDKDRTEKVLGNEYSTIYFNEASQISYNSYLIAKTRLAEKTTLRNRTYTDCNPPSVNHWIYKLFISKENPLSKGDKLTNPENFVSMQMNPYGNAHNLADGYIEDELATMPSRQRKRFLEGLFMDDIEGALWTDQIIERNRVTEAPPMTQIVVAIDPAVTAHKDSDETGIIVCGKGTDKKAYILEDCSGTYTPSQWAKKAIEAYYRHEADRIVCEVNNGGDLVESNISTFDNTIRIKQVRASRGKIIRAEPVVGLYEVDKVKHLSNLSGLELQMTTWDSQGTASPDRVDALVWGVTDILVNELPEFFSMTL